MSLQQGWAGRNCDRCAENWFPLGSCEALPAFQVGAQNRFVQQVQIVVLWFSSYSGQSQIGQPSMKSAILSISRWMSQGFSQIFLIFGHGSKLCTPIIRWLILDIYYHLWPHKPQILTHTHLEDLGQSTMPGSCDVYCTMQETCSYHGR